MLKRRLTLTLFLSVVMISSYGIGCPKGAYHDAVVAEHQFKSVTQAFQKAEITEFNNGRIDPAEHKVIEHGIEQVGMTAQVLVTSLQNGASNTTVKDNFATVSAALTDLLNNGVLHIKNQTSQDILKVSLAGLKAILDNVGQMLSTQTATTTTAGPTPATK